MKKVLQLFRLGKMIGIRNLLQMSSVHKSMLRYARSYMTMQCVLALEKTGFIKSLKKSGSISVEDYSDRHSLDLRYMEAVCEYLYVLGILVKQERSYVLSSKGEKFLRLTMGTFYFVHAYSPLFEELPALLQKKKKYKEDVFRREKYVAEATADVSQWIPIPAVRKIIDKYGFNHILDLGCGSARFLMQLCEKPGLRCVGVDISEESIEHGKELLKRAGLQDRVELFVGDIFNITSKSANFEKTEVMTSMYVLHEFLYEGKSTLIDLLADLKKHFPEKYLLVCELCRQEPGRMRRNPTAIAEHHLFHAISQQGLMTSGQWLELFGEAGYDCVEAIHFDFAGQSYFLLK